MPVTMHIRTAEKSDLSAIDGIYNEAIAEGFKTAHTEPMAMEERREWFEKFTDHKYPLYVCAEDGHILGWMSVSPYRPGREALSETAEVSFYVSKSARGRGVGSALLDHAIKEAVRLHFHVYIAILVETNSASINLLKKYGFEEWGSLPEVFHFAGERRGQYYFGKIL